MVRGQFAFWAELGMRNVNQGLDMCRRDFPCRNPLVYQEGAGGSYGCHCEPRQRRGNLQPPQRRVEPSRRRLPEGELPRRGKSGHLGVRPDGLAIITGNPTVMNESCTTAPGMSS